MKKMLLGLLVALLAVNLFAQTEDEAKKKEEADPYMVDSVIRTQFKSDFGKQRVYELSEYLNDNQRYWLYDENEKNAVCPFLLNLFLGYGIGSFVQGDSKGGVTQLLMSLGGNVLFWTGYGIGVSASHEETRWLVFSGYYSNYYMPDTETVTNNAQSTAGAIIMLSGLGLNLASNIIGYIRPWGYANKYNRDLKHYLRINESRWMSVTPQLSPIIDPVNQNYGLVATINF